MYARVMRKIRIRDLENFVALAEQESVTLAADAIGLSQPAMSAALKGLEKNLGMSLFVRRRGQGIHLTPQGVTLLAEARSLLAHADEVEARIDHAASSTTGRVILASLVTVAPLVVPSLVRRFRLEFPEIEVETRIGSHDQLLEWLHEGEINLALTYDIAIDSSLDFGTIADASPHVLLPAAHALASRKKIALEQLATEPYILLDLPLSKEYFSSLFLASGVACRPVSRFGDLSVIRAFVGNGFGYSLLNLVPASDVTQDGSKVAYVRLENPVPPLRLGLGTRRDVIRPKSLETFMHFARNSLQFPR